MSRAQLRRWIRIPIVFALLQVGFLISTLLAAGVPNHSVVAHLRAATHTGELSPLDYKPGSLGDQVDHYTECIALTIGIGRTSIKGLLARALSDRELGPCDTAVPHLSHGIGGPGPAYQDYYRYWHGYTVLTRPVLATGGVPLLRVLTALLLGIGFAALVTLIGIRLGWLVALALAAPLLLTADFWDVAGSIPHGLSMAVAFGGAALLVLRMRVDDRVSWVLWSLVAGSLYGFVDLMTNPPLAWALTAWLVGALVMKASGKAKDGLAASGIAAVSWAVGYGGTWATKWIIDIGAFGWKAFRTQILHEIAYRAGGSATVTQVLDMNLRFWTGPIGHRSLIAGALIGLAGVPVGGSWLIRRRPPWSALLVWPAGLTLLWFALVREQSFIQAFFTYRSLAMSLAIVLATSMVVARAGSQAARPPEEGPVVAEVELVSTA